MQETGKKIFSGLLVFLLLLCCAGFARAETTTFYHHDVLGTTLAQSDQSGNVVWWANYYPYGSKNQGNSSDTKPQKYTGKEFDDETGLYYFGARYYNPTLARFVSVDPASGVSGNPQTWNRYSYALNNPYKNIDPNGKWVESAIDIVSLGMSLHAAYQDPGNAWNWAAVAADAACLALPLATGGGMAVRALNKADDVVDAAKALNKGPIIIGENMQRVQAYAEKFGGKTINDFIPSSEWSKEANKRWIQQMRGEGREIIDTGPDFLRRRQRVEKGIRPDAPAYNMERMETKGYDGYKKVFERAGKSSGGVPNFD